MKKVFIAFCLLSLTSVSYAHLCNDVFIQAKDNLAVKVDVRDGQLRINESGEFRVYLLNTMDRDIADIRLEVQSEAFDSDVTPSPDWKSYPRLKTKSEGGKKEFFTVKLTRRQGVAEGKYSIGLCLFNGRDKSMVFKTVDMNDAAAVMEVPRKPDSLAIDGSVDKEEWKDALMCTSMYEYVFERIDAAWISQQGVNKMSDVQTRVRFSHDESTLYGMVDFQSSGQKDIVNIYISPDHDSTPAVLTADLQNQTVTLGGSDTPVEAKFSGTKVEFSLPLESVGLKNAQSFYVNVTRKQDTKQTYWRGNEISVLDPIVYANFILK
ncbi:MAG: hypothetical protein C4541_06140 [Candidatus Auribacter fodinae]|jgi:hypothetical protein|uniref:Uncharacterized protein n=1 Tax=Candidatus Auribacter fodinae TaxID=2093366 RepID=A0A3A4R985_9BACT|nr:MAG: hypothetical protein C4541_06140 [Candidatus Auribacter fodinae]